MLQKLRLERKIYSDSAILGVLYNAYDKELCKTLENPYVRNTPRISCIPEGKYICKSFSGSIYKNVWEVKDVPNRSAILFHNGNLERHTQGCILVGGSWGFLEGQLAVLNSRNTLENLRQLLPSEFELRIVRADEKQD